MNEESGHDSPELTRIEERLRMERTAVTGIELDQLKLRALGQARLARPTNRKGQFMKSRLALLSMIVLGLLMSSTGATLAISGSSGSGSAGSSQYGAAPNDDVLGDTDEQDPQPDDQGVLDDEGSGGDEGATGPADAQEVQQVAATGSGEDSLPFTGFLAIPLLIGGVALLGSGAVLRLKSRD